MKKILNLLFVAWSLSFMAASCGVQYPAVKAKYLILVSMDGFRNDYTSWYETPTLDDMALTGCSAVMMPSYPASTFPNHYTLATGLVPDHSGIVNNSFWDPELKKKYSMGGEAKYDQRFYAGEPIWNTAGRQGVKSGIVYWVGSDLHVNGKDPDYWFPYDNSNLLTYRKRVDTLLSFLSLPEPLRPRLLMIYFDEPDHTGHGFGPEAKEVGYAVRSVDRMVGRIREGLRELGLADQTDLIVLSDHGMAAVSEERVISPAKYLKREWYSRIVYGTPTFIYSDKPACRDSIVNALKDVEHISVWRAGEVPAELMYGTNPREGDIIIAPDLGWQFTDKPKQHGGAHGYSPFESEMQVVFRAEGPDFKQGYKAGSFQNIDIYPLACHILGITPAPNDGSLKNVKEMLR